MTTITGGDIRVDAAAGSGSFEASNSGSMQVAFAQVTGDLSLSNKNDDITLTLPANLQFSIDAHAKNGAVETDFPERPAVGDGAVSGAVGAASAVNVRLRSNDGDIRVTAK